MTGTKEVCSVLCSLLGNKASVPRTTTYDAAQSSYFSAQERELAPVCIVAPTSSSEVSEIVKTLVHHEVRFAVRSGGHTLNAGAANIDSGVTINLRSMNQVIVNEERSLVSVGAGAKWADVYPVVDALKLATSGGRVADVGVGGLTTGGGISFFSAREGLVCDNIENYEVVLADGSIVDANQNKNRDLWISLKGGSNNFGIVTRFDIRTFPQDNFYGGVIVYDISTIDIQLKGFTSLLENFDPYAAIIMSISWSQARNSYSIFNNLEYTKMDIAPAALQPFLQAKPQYLNTMRVSNLTDFTTEASKYAAPGLRNQFATTTFSGSLEMLTAVYNIWNTSISSISSIAGVNWAMTIQPFPKAFEAESSELGGNSLGLSTSAGPFTLFLISYSWNSTEDDEKVTAAAQRLIDDIDIATKKAGHFSDYKYLNYAAYWQNPIVGYGAESVKNLRKVSSKYDPTGVFQNLCTGGFKLPRD
ncbi:oxidoreductase FAD-binding protein [Rutstroemia sp. NJR-2017a BVV2]|nr:oxidoreductase FAD-binding protein [Rutstroemia sp. NJR-2017a BVV2]PQE19687.1 oxidoreductase FAD-binding protein [Rutstroemia sp. NJR-2017a BVV2]